MDMPTFHVLLKLILQMGFCIYLFFFQLRREKISERMKMLQKLVPGCEKVRLMYSGDSNNNKVVSNNYSLSSLCLSSQYLREIVTGPYYDPLQVCIKLTVFLLTTSCGFVLKIGNWKGPHVG